MSIRRWARMGGAVVAAVMASAALAATPAQAAPPQPLVGAGTVVRIPTGAPAGATVMGTLTVTSPQAAGYLTAYPCDQPRPTASNGNYRALQTVATFVAVRADSTGGMCVYTSAAAHVLFDQVATTGQLATTSPVRVLDTRRPADGAAPLLAEAVRQVDTGVANATVIGTLTATDANRTGFLTVFPCGLARPVTSHVTFGPGQSVANLVAVRADAQGRFCISGNADVHVIFDQVAAGDSGGALNTIAPAIRRFDSRTFSPGPLAAETVVRVPTGIVNGTVLGNLTVTEAQGSGYFTAFPCEQQRPVVSNLNFVAGQTVSNMAAVRTNSAGEFCLFTSRAAHVVFDEVATSAVINAGLPVRTADSRRDWLGASQVITVSVASASSQWHTYSLWQRGADGRYARVFGPAYGWVGEAGVGQANSWTARTPAGVYTLTQSFGIKDNPGTRLPFFKVDKYDWWNGDSTSPDYNTRYRGVVGPPNSEHLIDYGRAYWYSVVIDYNTERVPYAGAAFFLHVATGEPTGGCVSVSEADMVRIMRWLEPGQNPVISIGVGSQASAIVDRANS